MATIKSYKDDCLDGRAFRRIKIYGHNNKMLVDFLVFKNIARRIEASLSAYDSIQYIYDYIGILNILNYIFVENNKLYDNKKIQK